MGDKRKVTLDLTNASPELKRRIAASAESYANSQVAIATSADQRAAVMASVFAAAGAALGAGVITVAETARPSVIFGGIAASLLFLAAASMCVKATLPTGFWLPGNEPEDWAKDAEAGRHPDEVDTDHIYNLQTKITENREVIDTNAKWFGRGAKLGIAAPFLGLLVWLTFSFLQTSALLSWPPSWPPFWSLT